MGDLLSKLVDEKMIKVEKAHKQDIKNVTKVAMQEASNFIRKQCAEITKYLTQQHVSIINQYQKYKERNNERITYFRKFADFSADAELQLA